MGLQPEGIASNEESLNRLGLPFDPPKQSLGEVSIEIQSFTGVYAVLRAFNSTWDHCASPYTGPPEAISPAALGWVDDLTTTTAHTYICVGSCAGSAFTKNTTEFWPAEPDIGVFLVRDAVPVPRPCDSTARVRWCNGALATSPIHAPEVGLAVP